MSKKSIFLIAIISILTLVLAACGSNNAAPEKKSNNTTNKSVHFVETEDLLTLNTTNEEDFASFTAQNQVLEGLYSLDKQDNVIPAVAKSLPKISADKKTYTIQLRDDAKWSDGSAVTAKDFVYAWQRAVSPKTAPSYSILFVNSIKNAKEVNEGKLKSSELGVKAVNDHELQIELIKPISYFPSLLSFQTFFPIKQSYLEKQGDKYGTSSATTLYNGPFTLKGWSASGDGWTYVKNKNYWDAKNVKVDDIKVSVVKNTGTAVNLYQSGDVDRVVLDGEFAKQYRGSKDFQNEKDALVAYLRLNETKESPLKNKDLRKAVSLAINKETLVNKILDDGSFVADGFIPKNFINNPETNADFRTDAGTLQKQDLKDAQTAWKAAQKALGKDKINLVYLTSDSDTDKKIAEYITDQLQKDLPGLTVEIKALPSKNKQQAYFEGDYDISDGAWMPDYKDATTYLNIFESKSSQNYIGFKNTTYDQLLNDADNKNAGNDEARWKNLVAAENILVNKEYAITPLYQKQTALLQKDRVANVVKHNFGSPYSYKYITVK